MMNAEEVSTQLLVGRVAGAFALTVLVLMLSSVLATVITGMPLSADVTDWAGPAVTHLSMAAISLILMFLIDRKDRRRFGLRFSFDFGMLRILLLSLAVAIPASIAAELLNAGGYSPTEGFSFLQIVLFVILLGSICEEVLFRGFIQGFLSPLRTKGFSILGCRISLPTAVAAVLFGLIHLSLWGVGIKIGAVLVIVMSGIVLGVIAGHYRERTGSLIPALLVHIFFNVGGAVADFMVDMF